MERRLPVREDFTHFVEQSTRWRDEDRLGHVNNAMYFTYEETTRISYLDRVFDRATAWTGGAVIVAHIECDFVAQLHHPAVFDMGFRVASLGGSSMSSEGAIFVGDEVVAVTRSVIVFFDYEADRSVRITDEARAAIRAFERKAPEEQ